MINTESILNKFKLFPSNDTSESELKKEHELNTNDRMYLINKDIDEKNKIEIFSNIVDNKRFYNNNNNIDINDYVFNDIEFLHDHYLNDANGIFHKINNCKTNMGMILLKKILLNPISDINILRDRQKIISNIKLAKGELVPLIDKLSILENDLIWFWNNSNMKHIELLNDMIYFNYDIIPFFNLNEVLNNSERALLISNIYKIIISPLLTVLTPIVSLLFPLILLFYFQRKTNIKIPVGTVIKEYFKVLFSNQSMYALFKSPSKAMIASIITKGIYIFMYCQNIYYSLQNSYNTNKIINIIHEKLNKMTEYIYLSKKVNEICVKYDINNLSSFITYSKNNDDIKIYEEYFKYSVFSNEPKLFSNKGKILYIFKEFQKNKENITNLFHVTGIIDSLLSIEKLLSDSNSFNPYCMCNYVSNDKPIIEIKNIWHPFLNNNNTVKNTVDVSNNILITGPNAAGKSTFIKSVIVNIIMSQTIGISSSEKFKITPFHLIETYLHIPDSKGSSSLFEAEMIRSKTYIEKIKNMDENKFSFIVLDEIFSSTNYVEGFSGAYAILKKISSFSNTLSITTTHYTDLEVLEKDTKGKIINYKFEVDYDNNKEIKFNYILKRGMSRQYIALDLLKKNGFDDDLIEEAIKMCNKIKENKILHNSDNKNVKNNKKNKKMIVKNKSLQ